MGGCRLCEGSGSSFGFGSVCEFGEEWLVVDGGDGRCMSVAFGEGVLVLRVLGVAFGARRGRFCGMRRGREVCIFMYAVECRGRYAEGGVRQSVGSTGS